MLIHPPTRVVRPEVRDMLRCREGPIAVIQRNPYPVLAEPNNVGFAIAREIHDKTRVLIHAPALIDTEVLEH